MVREVMRVHDGMPTWTVGGGWGLLPWDHQFPGVIIGTRMFVLKLSWDYASYPSVGIAEIRSRDYTDRINHAFTTWATLDQIAAAGDLSQDAYIFTDGRDLYYSAIVSWYRVNEFNNYAFTPTRCVLYRLDSVGEDQVGSFTLVASSALTTTVNSTMDWLINGHPDLAWTDNGYYLRYSRGGSGYFFNETRDTSERLNYSDSYGTFSAYKNEIGTAEMVLLPFTSGMTSRKIQVLETFTPRAFRSTPQEKLLSPHQTMEWVGVANSGFTGQEDPSTDWSVLARPALTGNYPRPWKGASSFNPDGLFIPHPVSFSGNWRTDYAEMWGLVDVMDNYVPSNATGTISTRHYILNHAASALEVFDLPAYSPSNWAGSLWDTIVGLWGTSGAVVWRKVAWYEVAGSHLGQGGVDYEDFYVIKASDTGNVNRYSIFSGVEEDGRILHIEGLEDPTPTLWLDNLQIGSLN